MLIRCILRPTFKLRAFLTSPSNQVGKRNSSSAATSIPSHSHNLIASTMPSAKQDPLFSYTSGRFLFNEEIRLKERHVPFNEEALQRAAEISVREEHGPVVSLSKLAEGGFNRVLNITFKDGFELIAKIPYHIARPEYYTTASEAATLTYLRSKGFPVPEVYAYCATSDTPVGTEYILMEKATGVSLASMWSSLEDDKIKRLAHSFVELEKKLFQIPFSATGSLYRKDDIPLEHQTALYKEGHGGDPKDAAYCIGPIADYMFWYGRRAGLNISRGPWTNPVEYLKSIAQKEIDWARNYGKPMEPSFPHNAFGLGTYHPEEYIKLLESYQSVTSHLLPKDPTHPFNQPTLRHSDLTPANIFITPDTGRISCLIDWQHAIIQPQLLAAGYPRAFENPDFELPSELAKPQLPDEFATLNREEKTTQQELYRRRLLFYCYRVFNGAFNPAHREAVQDPLILGRQMLVDRAGRQFEGNIITLKGALVRTAEFWEHLPDVEGIACPLKFDQNELDKFAEEEGGWLNCSMLVEEWRKRLCNMTEEGWVRNRDYNEAKKRLGELWEEMRKQCEDDEEDIEAFRKGWPFRDREEVD